MKKEFLYLKDVAIRKHYLGLLSALNIVEHRVSALGVLTAYQLAILDLEEEAMLSSALLHGTCANDPGAMQVLLNDLQDPVIINHVLTLVKNECEPWAHYFEEIKQDPVSLFVKLAERALMLSQIIQKSPYPKIWLYVLETEEYILPLCTYGAENYPQYERQFLLLENQIGILCDALRAFIEKAQDQG